MDFYEASSEIETTELQLQNCDEISLEKQGAYQGQLMSEWLFDVLHVSKNQRNNLMKFFPRIKKLLKLEN